MSSTAVRKPRPEGAPNRRRRRLRTSGEGRNRAGRPARARRARGLRAQRADPALDREPDEREPEGLQRPHRPGEASAPGAVVDPERRRSSAGGAPGARDPRSCPRLHASVHWRELLFLRVVADFAIDRPVAYVNLPQLRSELADEVPVDAQGLAGGGRGDLSAQDQPSPDPGRGVDLLDDDPERPLELTQLEARATNIRNIHSKERTYPSPIEASAVWPGRARRSCKGHADFLAAPHAGVKGEFRLAAVPLDAFGNLAEHWNVLVSGGTFSAAGEVEYASQGPKPLDARDHDRAACASAT